MKLLIKNGTYVTATGATKRDIFIKDGKVVEGAESLTDCRVIDAKGLYVLEGLVDMHVHLRDPGQTYKEDIKSGTKAAVKGGFTAICCMPNTTPVNDNIAITAYIKQRAKEVGACKVYPIATITKEQKGHELTEMKALIDAGAVALSDDGLPVRDSNTMRLALEYAKTVGMPIISHAEDTDLVAGGVVNEGYNATISGLRPIPSIAEDIMVARDVILAEYLSASIHIAHVSTLGAVDIIRKAKARGVKVTAETCPHYFVADDSYILSYDTNAKVNPPLRSEADKLAIIEGIKDGTIDAIATDHAPHAEVDKNVEFNYAPFGISGLETAFSLAYTSLVEAGVIDISRLVELMSVNPKKILNISGDKVADFTIVDLNSKSKIKTSEFVSKGKNSPFDGMNVQGKVVYTVVDGEVVYEGVATDN